MSAPSGLAPDCAYQGSETERAALVVTHAPELEALMGFLHPMGSLYELPYPPDAAARDHEGYRRTLERFGCRVRTVRDVLVEGAERPAAGEEPSEARKALLDLAASRLDYQRADESAGPLPERVQRALGEDYKREVLAQCSADDLARVVLLGPLVDLEPSGHNTGLVTRSVSLRAAQNLVFTRDQQITTRRGVVLGNFNAAQRLVESRIMHFCWKKLGFGVVGDMGEQNLRQQRDLGLQGDRWPLGAGHRTLEGGDFIMASPALAASGCGLRTTYPALLSLMDCDLLGTPRFIVVNDVFDHDQDRMHLDCIFSPIHDKLVVLDEHVMLGKGRRWVDEWHKEGDSYRLRRASVEFVQWLRENGYSIIPLKHEFQLAYGCNMLNLGPVSVDGKEKTVVLGVHEESARAIMSSPVFAEYCQAHSCEIEVVFVPFRGVTSMYGSLHCASQVVQRVESPALTAAAEAEAAEAASRYSQPAAADCILYVPSFASEELAAYRRAHAPETSPDELQAAIIGEAYQTYQDLVAQGRTVYPWFKTAFAPVICLAEVLSTPATLEDAIRRLSSPGLAPAARRGDGKGSSLCEKALGLRSEDLVYYFNK